MVFKTIIRFQMISLGAIEDGPRESELHKADMSVHLEALVKRISCWGVETV